MAGIDEHSRSLAAASAIRAPQGVVAALEEARKFIESEYRDPSAEPSGEWLAPEARPVHAKLVAALTPAPSSGEAGPQDGELPDDMRSPLHSLQADLDWLVARIRSEDDEVAGMCKDSIRNRLSQIEEAAYRLASPSPSRVNAEVVAALAKQAADAVGVTPRSDMRLFVEQAVKYALQAQAAASGAGEMRDAVTDQTLEPTVKAMMAEHRAIEREIARLRTHYQSGSMLDAGRRQILDHFGAILQTGKKA